MGLRGIGAKPVRKGGLLLRQVERSAGGRPAENSSDDLTSYQAALEAAGMNRELAHRWQVMSWCPAAERDAWSG
jgi:hypothetical protein